MAFINLVHSYAKAVLERFAHESVTDSAFSKEFDVEFHGVKSVTFHSIGTAPVNDYTRSGSNRYGNPDELDDFVQEFTMTQDKSSTWTIDKGNNKEQYNIKSAAKSLARQMDEVYTPMIDKYRFSKWADGAGQVAGVATPTKSTIVGMMLDADLALDEAGVPENGRTFYVPTDMYKFIITSDEFTHADEFMLKAYGKGVVGELFGRPVKKIPRGYLPTGVYFMEVYKGSAISPVKLNEYHIHTDPPGISGDLVEMRMMYDAFVIGTRANGIYVAAGTANVQATPTISLSSGVATITSSGATKILYTLDGSDPRYSKNALVYNGSAKPELEAGQTIKAAALNDSKFTSGVAESVNAA